MYLKECEESEATHKATSMKGVVTCDSDFKGHSGDKGVWLKEINRWDKCEFEEGQARYNLSSYGDIQRSEFNLIAHQMTYNQGNLFVTKQEAETERDKRQALATIQRYLRATQECKGKWVVKRQQELIYLSVKTLRRDWAIDAQFNFIDLYYDSREESEKGLELLRKEYQILFGVD